MTCEKGFLLGCSEPLWSVNGRMALDNVGTRVRSNEACHLLHCTTYHARLLLPFHYCLSQQVAEILYCSQLYITFMLNCGVLNVRILPVGRCALVLQVSLESRCLTPWPPCGVPVCSTGWECPQTIIAPAVNVLNCLRKCSHIWLLLARTALSDCLIKMLSIRLRLVLQYKRQIIAIHWLLRDASSPVFVFFVCFFFCKGKRRIRDGGNSQPKEQRCIICKMSKACQNYLLHTFSDLHDCLTWDIRAKFRNSLGTSWRARVVPRSSGTSKHATKVAGLVHFQQLIERSYACLSWFLYFSRCAFMS